MSFLWPNFLWFLSLVPLLSVALWILSRRRERSAQAFADAHLLPRLLRRPSKAHLRWMTGLQIAALSALLLAAARPVASPPLPVNKAAVVIALDASRSMLAEDVSPNRLEVARKVAESFVGQAPSTTQIGLVSFSDVASILVPPTTDRQVLLEALAEIGPASNTSLVDAVVAGVRMLPGRERVAPPEELDPPGFIPPQGEAEELEKAEDPPPGAMIILSDGVSNVGSNPNLSSEAALDIAARFATDNEVRLFTYPIGREGGTVARIDGQDYFIPFEPRSLERLAERSDGEYLYPTDEQEVLSVFRTLGRAVRWESIELEISSLLSGLALVLMLVAGYLSLVTQRRVP
ncbi:MAG: VWA domain-containing protein [Trueperaceae bacterium]|nr:MAG: VWA domain-containing protein [Trueperaceae bacterium]